MSETDTANAEASSTDTEKSEVTEHEAEVVDFDSIKLEQVSTGDPKEERIAELERELEDWRARAYRSAADMENLRKRFQRERDDLRKFGVEALFKELFGVMDNLERAIGHAEPDNTLAEGVDMVLRQFIQAAAKHGAEPFEAAGLPFDPQVHEAMTQVPTSEQEPGTVVDVFQRGWTLHGRLVRPAMVTVAAAPAVAPDDSKEEDDVSSIEVDADGQAGDNE
jgi:molecular chaperone GrpE